MSPSPSDPHPRPDPPADTPRSDPHEPPDRVEPPVVVRPMLLYPELDERGEGGRGKEPFTL